MKRDGLMAEERVQRRLAAILAADVAGYSRLMGEDEEGTFADLTAHRTELIEPCIGVHRGRVVKTTGDGLLAEFASVVDAVRCALAFQHGMTERNATATEERRIAFRIGINLGDIMVHDDDVYGDGVNIAARLEGLADPGGLWLSEDAFRQVRGKVDCDFEDMGSHVVKNIAEPIRAYRARQGNAAPSLSRVAAKPEPSPALRVEPSIAVLPFANSSGDPEQEYFSDGIAEDIIVDMSKVNGLLVIARNSAFTYKGKTIKAKDVAQDLGVRYVLEGSVRKAGARVRVTAQLVDATSGMQLWSERYDRELDDIFALQSELSLKIVASTAVTLSERDSRRLVHRGTHVVDAYDHLLRGRDQLMRHTPEANARALEHFEKAVALDPNYAEAYVHLAESQLQRMQLGWVTDPRDLLDCAQRHAEQAVAIDDEFGPGHGVLGQIHLWRKNHDAAVAEGERRMALNPGDAEGAATFAFTLLFSGEPERALETIERAMRLDPQYPFWHLHIVGMSHFAMDRYDEAAVAFRRGIVRNPDSMPLHMVLAATAALSGDMDTARAELAESRRLDPDLAMSFVTEQVPYRRAEDVERLVRGLEIAGLEA